MTFEEYFAKKRIDLALLEKADPGLYAEFKSHFSLMGEKSFDHTKKFWFNKLRHLYHLSTPAKEVAKPVAPIAAQAEPLASPSIEQRIPANKDTTSAPPVNKPAFKPRNIPAKPQVAQSAEEKQADETPAIKKPAFKPRNVKPAADAQSLESRPGQQDVPDLPVTEPDQTKEAENQGYKPRFKPRNIPQAAKEQSSGDEQKIQPESSLSGDEATESKPAYKPRFNMKNVAAKPVEEPSPAPDESESEKEKQINSTAAESPKPAYKPKFSMKNIQTAKQPELIKEESFPEIEEAKPSKPSDKTEESPAKPSYKPRFNMKNIKPKTEEE